MTLIQEIQQWRKDLDELNLVKVRAEGKLEQAMEDLKKAGFDSVDAARLRLAELVDKKLKLELAARVKLDEFKIKYERHIK